MSELFPFQQKLIEDMLAHRRLFVAADMGLGKTRCAIEAAARVGAERVLVLAPAIGLVSWPAECGKWAPGIVCLPISDPAMVPDPSMCAQPTFVIVPFSEVERRPRAWVDAAKRFNADVTVIDEAHYLANLTAARTQAVYGYRADLKNAMAQSGQIVWPMSGTPAPSFTSQLWTHLHALAPEKITLPGLTRPMAQYEFQERFSLTRTSTHGLHVTGSKNTPALRKLVDGFFHRIKKQDVLKDMPPITWTAEPIPVSADNARQALDIPQGLDDGQLLDWLKATYPEGSSERKATGMAKVAGAIEWARNFLDNSADRKLILFGWHRDVMAAVTAGLKSYGVAHIDGDTPLAARQINVGAFQTNPACRVFNGQMHAAGTAITLTAASDVAFYEDDWTPGTMEQAAARADRLGQTRGVVARVLYMPGSKDERIAQVRVAKAREFKLMFN